PCPPHARRRHGAPAGHRRRLGPGRPAARRPHRGAAAPGRRGAGAAAGARAQPVPGLQRGAGAADQGRRGGASAAARPGDPGAVLAVPPVLARVLAGHALEPDAGADSGAVRSVLRRLLAGELTEAEAEAELRRVQLEELDGRARLDLGRVGRRGLPEVILASGKRPDEAARLAVTLAQEQGQGLASRLGPDHLAALEGEAEGAGLQLLRYHAGVRVLR